MTEPIEMPFGMMTWVGRRYYVLHGGLDPPTGMVSFEENVTAHCKVMGHSAVSCAKTAKLTNMPFSMRTWVVQRNQGCRSPNGKGQFSAVVWAIQIQCSRRSAAAAAFTAKGIIQSPITSCSRRDHSVCQASANRNLENYERRR